MAFIYDNDDLKRIFCSFDFSCFSFEFFEHWIFEMCVACIVLIRRSYPNASTVSAIADNKQIASINAVVHVDDRTRETESRKIDEGE